MSKTLWMNYQQAAAKMISMIIESSREQQLVNLAVQIVKPFQQGFPVNEAAALCRYVRDNIRYTNDTYGEDIFRAPLLTVKLGSGDCNNKAVLFASLARAIGFPTRLVFLFEKATPDLVNDYPIHVWPEVEVYKGERSRQKWVACEATPLPNAAGRLADLVPFGVTGDGGGARVTVEVDPGNG